MHEAADAEAKYVPGAHPVHADAEGLENKPAAHVLHDSAALAEYFPDAHSMHELPAGLKKFEVTAPTQRNGPMLSSRLPFAPAT